jgi:DNA-binding SARP family transcriptional activator/tetratricopeptide (TPR) repeat protein
MSEKPTDGTWQVPCNRLATRQDGLVSDVRLHLLGRFRVHRAGEEIQPAAFGGRKVRTLLRVLAVRRPDLVPHGVLAEALWPDRLPADPVANLNVLVGRARRALDDPGLVVTGAGGYALGDCQVDVAEFLDAVSTMRAAAPAAALEAARVALALWADPLPEDSYADWARDPRDRLLRAHVDVLEGAARSAFALGEVQVAAAHAADAVAAAPLRESGVLLLAEALAAGGDRAAALATLAQLRTRLAEQLGVDPSPQAAQLQLRLLRGEPFGEPSSRPPSGPPSRPAREEPTGPPSSTGPGSPAPFEGLTFRGRDAELARLRDLIAERGVAAVGGVAGVGKSRLLAEALRGSPLPVIAARAFQPERDEAWSVARALLSEVLALDAGLADLLPAHVRHALAGLLPEVSDEPPPRLDGESRRALLMAGALRLLGTVSRDGAVLVLDDLQWVDPSSLALIGSALARLPRLAAVVAYRPDELPPVVLTGLRAARAVTEIPLGPLPAAEIARLVGDPRLAQALATGTDGTPFAVAEVLRELVSRGAVLPGPEGLRPRGADAVALAVTLGRAGRARSIRRRVERHGADAELLALVALAAREVSAATLAAAAGRPQREVLDVLAELATAELVRLGEQGWAPAHDLVAETVAGDLPPEARGRLHGLLARALETEGADLAEVARHYRDSGDSVTAAAAYARAARAALTGHATREAAALADRGLELDPRPELRANLLEVRAEARAAHGEISPALADLHQALATDPGGPRARRLSRLAMVTFGARDPGRAGELAELAVVAAGDDAASQALALETAAILDMNLGRPDRATERAEAALVRYRRLGDAGGVARILDGRAMATFLAGRIEEGVDLLGRVADLFSDSGELLRVVTPRSTCGHGLVFLDRPDAGLADASTALRLARSLGAPEGQAYALWHRSEALSALGRGAEAQADACEALEIATSAGHRGWTATAHRAVGIALQVQGRLDDAAAAFQRSSAVAGDDLTLFASWAAARGALVAVECGRLDLAERLVRRALAAGPPLGHYEARLASVELAVAQGRPDAVELARTALALARSGGHAASASRLAALADPTRTD